MKRKPHDMHRRYLRQAQHAVRGIGAAFITGRTSVECVNMRSGSIIKPDGGSWVDSSAGAGGYTIRTGRQNLQ